MSCGWPADRLPRPFPPAGDSAHALHAGFRPSRHAPAPRNRKLRLPCHQARGRRALLPRQHRAPPRQLPKVRTEATAPHVQSRSLPGLRRRHSDARPPQMRRVPGERPGGQPRPQTAVARRAAQGRALPALRPARPRRRQDQLRRLPCRAPPGPWRPRRETAASGRPFDLYRMRRRASCPRTPPLPGLPATHRKARQGRRQTPPGSPRRRRSLRRLRTALGRSRSHGLRSLPRRLAGPLQPEGPGPRLPRAVHKVRDMRAPGGVRLLQALQGQAPRRISGQMASQGRRLQGTRRLRPLRRTPSRPRVRRLHRMS